MVWLPPKGEGKLLNGDRRDACPTRVRARLRPLLCDRSRDVLAALNKGSEHKLGDWGFEVEGSAQAKPAPAPAQNRKTSGR